MTDPMTEPTITCPSCSTEIKLTESLAGPLIEATRQEFEVKLAEQAEKVSEREGVLKKKENEIAAARKNLEDEVSEKVKEERIKIVENEAKKAKLATAGELTAKTEEVTELQGVLQQRDEKLAEAQKAQADILKQKRALDDAKRELELTVETRVLNSVEEVRKKAKLEAEGALNLKISEREEKIASMTRQIEDLKKRAEQGSQQLQGEVLELELEEMLKAKFPFDSIEPVPKGEFGGDIIQRVTSPTGQASGIILWELKRTKNWSEGWLAKLRNDQRSAKAEFSILVSTALPKEVDNFDQIEGVWVSAPQYFLPLAMALRQSLIDVAQSKQSQEGQQTKMELVYGYLMGPNFRHRVEAIVEKISDMQGDLDREKKAMMRSWAKRDTQIQNVIEATVGMYGDLQGIAGRGLQEIEGLELPLIEQDPSLFADETE
ncbi:DUF2130 domain-containing protein [Rhodospirillales bacterium]|nr:DUF2130 domain-containing protein [Rhodospirillales bacterium]